MKPDLIVIDGGQLSASEQILRASEIKISQVIALNKRAEEVFVPKMNNPSFRFRVSSSALRLLINIRDEAISFRYLTSQKTLQQNIGKRIERFGGRRKIPLLLKESKVENIANAKGGNSRLK